MCVINFNSKLQPINFNLASIGAINYAIASPREVLKSAILSNAANMMILHNLMDIPLLDHIIVGPEKGRYFSMRDKKLVDFRKSSAYSTA